MSGPGEVPVQRRREVTIPTTCQLHEGRRFCNLRVTKVDGDIVLDPHVAGSCVIVLGQVVIERGLPVEISAGGAVDLAYPASDDPGELLELFQRQHPSQLRARPEPAAQAALRHPGCPGEVPHAAARSFQGDQC